MARPQFDQTGNEQWHTFVQKLNTAFDDLYGADNAQISGEKVSTSLTTAAGATTSVSITNAAITATSKVFVSVKNGTNTQGLPVISTITPASGSAAVVIANLHASAAFNGTLKLEYFVVP